MSADRVELAQLIVSLLKQLEGMDWEQLDEHDEAVVRFVCGTPREVVVDVSKDDVLVYRWEARWDGPAELVANPKMVGQIPLKSHGPGTSEQGFAATLTEDFWVA